MADYKQMYLTLFREVTKVITLLQEAQITTEDIFLSSDEAPIQVLPPSLSAASIDDEDNG